MVASRAIRDLLGDESGHSGVEYAVLLALIAVVALIAVTAFATQSNQMMESLDAFIDQTIAESALG